MFKRVLFSLDLEGVNNVVGDPYSGLVKDCEQWDVARRQAVLEINAGAQALFDAGVETVALWDGHGGGFNIIAEDLDPRIILLDSKWTREVARLSYAKDNYDCICYFGYHTMEGTLGGVLAHTMSSVTVQHYKLNGKYIGEVDMDAYITAEYDIPSCFFVGGDLTCKQAERAIEGIVTVVTKKEISRNEAIYRDNAELLAEIKEKIVQAVNGEYTVKKLTFPAVMEKSMKRVEDAAKYIASRRAKGINCEYLDDEILGKDAHTVVSIVNNIDEFVKCI